MAGVGHEEPNASGPARSRCNPSGVDGEGRVSIIEQPLRTGAIGAHPSPPEWRVNGEVAQILASRGTTIEPPGSTLIESST
jgi:hypothetical protein